MLTLQNKQLNSVFERIVKDKNGILVRVRFTIVEVNGIFQGQIISATPLIKEKAICLPCEKDTKVVIEKEIVFSKKIVSPYFSLDFLMSQPTRAPSFI
jgi:hypothetical protein